MKSSLILLSSLYLLASCSTPITATSNKIGHHKGEACSRDLFFIIPLSLDSSIYSAAKEGKLTEISTVDQTSLYTVFYNQRCTVVHGNRASAEKAESVE